MVAMLTPHIVHKVSVSFRFKLKNHKLNSYFHNHTSVAWQQQTPAMLLFFSVTRKHSHCASTEQHLYKCPCSDI